MIEQSLFATIGPLLGGRFFPDNAPFDTPKPFGFYTQVGGESPTFTDKAPIGIRNARMQLNIWCVTRQQATQIMRQIEAALLASTDMDVTPLGALVAISEPDLGLYGAQQDFSCWKNE